MKQLHVATTDGSRRIDFLLGTGTSRTGPSPTSSHPSLRDMPDLEPTHDVNVESTGCNCRDRSCLDPMESPGCLSFGKKVRFDVTCKSALVAPTSAATLSILTMKKPPGALLTVDAPEWQEIEMTVDSGACDTVMPASIAPHISLLANEFSRAGYEYEVANGAGLPNQGKAMRHDD